MRRFAMLVIALAVTACGAAENGTGTTSGVQADTTTTEDVASTTTASTSTTTQSTGDSSLASPIAVGAVVQVGEWRLRVSGVIPDATDQVMAENQFNDPPLDGNQFFIATLEATYTGTESSTFWIDLTLKAVGESNVAYEPFEAHCGVIPDDINDTGEVFPGGTVTGNVCWSVLSTDINSLVMAAEESFSFDETRAFFSLDPAATPVDETTAGTDNGSERGPTVAIGQSATVGSWEIRVVSITPDATDQVLAENQFNDPPIDGNQFLIASLEATYNGTESSTFWIDMTLKAVGESNVAYEPFEATCGVVPDEINDTGEVFPGGTVTGNVCWSVQSSDVDSLVMIAEESFTLDGTRALFALTE